MDPNLSETINIINSHVFFNADFSYTMLSLQLLINRTIGKIKKNF